MSNVYVKELNIFYPFKIWVKGSCRQAGFFALFFYSVRNDLTGFIKAALTAW